MNNGKKRLKIAALLFAMMFVVGTAFAATNGMLAFGGTVRINNVESAYARLEFNGIDMSWEFREDWGSVWASPSADVFKFGVSIYDANEFINNVSFTDIPFSFQNTGNVPVNFTAIGGMTSHGSDLPLFLRDPNTGTYLTIFDLWMLETIYPGQVVTGWIQICNDFIQESLDWWGQYSQDGWLSFDYNLELHYEQAY